METVLDIEGIMKALPHRYPFLLLDRVIEWERGERLVAIKNVTMNEPFFQGHFPGNPVMPGVLILEAMAQGAAILMKNEDDVDVVPLFMGIDKARFRRQVVPGDQLRLEVQTLQKRRNVCKGAGKAFVGDELAAEAELMAMLVPRDQL
jgi:3-hydroxyacyl-[acyl-carrier-protein] dehydratase